MPIPIPLPGVSFMLGADFNADGHEDLLLVDPGRSVAVLLDNGTGPFAAPVVSALPYGTARPGVGDVDGDGIPDLVVSDYTTATGIVMLGHGDGSFTTGSSFGTVTAPGPIALADFNGDGWLDVAVASANTETTKNIVSVHLGDGTGHFTSGPTTTIKWLLPRVIAPVDMNLDGTMDLVASDPLGPTLILLGDGLGGFTSAGTMAGGEEIVTGDFNHDGKPDLAAVPRGNSVAVGLGQGDGTLISTARYDVGYDSSAVVGADVDEDGNLDLLATGTAGSEVALLRGNPDGTFQPAELFVSGPSTWKIAAGDYDRDGHADFVTLDYNAQQVWALSYVRGSGDGRFKTYRAFSAGPAVAESYANYVGGGVVADMNNDGKPDVVVIQQRDTSTWECDLNVMLNDGHGNLATPILSDSGERSWSGHPAFAVGDLDGDGVLDAVVVSSFAYLGAASSLLGTGDGHFFAPTPLSITATGRPTLGHFSSGVNVDLFIDAGTQVAVYPGNGDGTFGTGIVSSTPGDTAVVGDLNGDGKLDYVCSSPSSVSACLNDGTGRFSCSLVSSRETHDMALADLNGDGTLDVLVTVGGGTEARFGNGDGTFGPPLPFTLSPGCVTPFASPVPTADFDGDGKIDVALGTTILLGNGDGTFRSRATFRTVGATATAAADMDGSGSPDLVVVKSSADAVDVLLTRIFPDPTAEASISLRLDTASPVYGQSVKLTATVTGGALALGGAVRFTIDGHDTALVDVARDGTAIHRAAFTVGSHTVGATYIGDDFYQEATTSLELEVGKAPTAVSISGSPNPQIPDWTVTAYVSVSAPRGTGLAFPTGTLALRDGDTPLLVQVVNGRAQLRGLALGAHVISADYSGDANFMPSSKSYTQLMCVTPDATISAPIDVAAVSAGNLASVRAAGSGATYAWTITNADITSGLGTPSITFTAGVAGSIQLSVVVQTPGGCQQSESVTVAILPFRPDQALADGVIYPLAGLQPSTMAIGDLNGDGRDDLAIGGASLIVMLQQGDGTLGAPVTYPSSGGQSIAIGDLNGDGRADIAIANQTVVFFQQSDGSFVPSSFETPRNPYQVATGDVTHDGRTDLVAMPWGSNTNELYVFEQQADGSLVRRDWTISGGGYDCMRLADVNGDGLLDLMVVSPQAGSRVAMRFGDPTRGFGDEALIPLPWAYGPYAVAAGDFSGDGRVDLAIVNDLSIGLLLQDTDGGFSAGQALPVLPWPNAVVSSDLNHDGLADLATVGFEGPNFFVEGWLQGPAEGFRAEKYLMPSVPSNYNNNGQMAAGDLNGDGHTDLAVALDGGGLAVFYGARVMPVTAPAIVGSGAAGSIASVPDAGRGATYTWTIANGTITEGSGSRSIVFTAGVSGAVQLNVTVQSRTLSTSSGARSVTICGTGMPGDVNGDGTETVGDVFYMINYLFANGASPIGCADINGDGQVAVADVFYLVNYLFAGGPAPARPTWTAV